MSFESWQKQNQETGLTDDKFSAWQQENVSVHTQEAQSLVGRFGKGLYNMFTQIPAGIIKTAARIGAAGEPEDLMKQIKQAEQEIRQKVKTGEMPPERLTELEQRKEKSRQIAQKLAPYPVSPAETWPETAVDIGAQIAGTVAQIALLRKAMPTQSMPVIWEMQNLMTGGTPGVGAAYGATLGAVGKLPLSQVEKAGAEALSLYTLGRITGAEPTEAAAMAAVPAVLRGIGVLLRRIRGIKGITNPEQVATVKEKLVNLLPATKERPLLPKPPLQLGAAPPPKQLPMSFQEKVNRAANQLYDDLLAKAETGNKRAISDLNKYTQGRNLPTLNQLYEKVGMGDIKAAEDIARGAYSDSPNAGVLGFQEAAKQKFKLTPPREPLPVGEGEYRRLIPIEETKLIRRKHFTTTERTRISQQLPQGKVETRPIPDLQTKAVKTKITAIPPLSSELESVNQQLLDWSKTTKKLRSTEVAAAISKLHRRQAAKGTGILQRELGKGEKAWVALKRVKRGFAGAAEVPDVTPPLITEAQRELYAKRILEIYPATDASVTFSREHMVHSLDKFLSGKIPTNAEFMALDKLFGREVTLQLYDALASQRPLTVLSGIKFFIQLLKSPFAADVQFARQASGFAVRHPVIYGKGVYRNVRAYLSEQFTKDLETQLERNPNHADAKKYVNFLSRLPYAKSRPEWYQFGLSEKLAKVGAKKVLPIKIITAPVRGVGKMLLGAERGFVTATDAALQELWDAEARVWANQNLTAGQLRANKTNYGNLLNSFMKVFRAKSPSGKVLQQASNYVLFSPGMTISRPAQIKHLLANKQYRGYAAGLIATNIAKITAISVLANTAGNLWRQKFPDKPAPIDGEINPLKGNWGKVKVKNSWFDYAGGDAQFFRTIARLTVGAVIQAKQNITGEPPAREYVGGYRVQKPSEVFVDYSESRETAAIGFVRAIATKKDFFGKPISPVESTIRAFTFAPIQETYDALMMDGTATALLAGASSVFSAGVQTYPTAAYLKRIEFEDKIAETKYNKKWEDLTPQEQLRLRFENRKQFNLLEQQVKTERIEKPKEISIEEQQEAGQWILKQLPKSYRQRLTQAGVGTGVSRYLGKYRLNTEKYKQYQQLVAQNIAEALNKNPTTNPRLLESVVRVAKAKARMKIRK